jgi:heat shock protein HslJ
MRPALIGALVATLVLPSSVPAAGEWRIARVWDTGTARSQALAPSASARSTAAVVPPGILSLSVGCNAISATGLRQDGTALLSPARTTRMGCPPDLAAIETSLLGAMELIRSHERTGNEMILRDAEGKEVLALIR